MKPNPNPDDLPQVSAATVLIRVAIEAHLKTSTRKRGLAFLRVASDILANEASVAMVFPIRPTSHSAEVAQAQREAMALWRQLLPAFMACLPEE